MGLRIHFCLTKLITNDSYCKEGILRMSRLEFLTNACQDFLSRLQDHIDGECTMLQLCSVAGDDSTHGTNIQIYPSSNFEFEYQKVVNGQSAGSTVSSLNPETILSHFDVDYAIVVLNGEEVAQHTLPVEMSERPSKRTRR